MRLGSLTHIWLNNEVDCSWLQKGKVVSSIFWCWKHISKYCWVVFVDDIVFGSFYSLLNILWQSNKRIISKGFPASGVFPCSLTKPDVSCRCVDYLLFHCIYYSVSNYCWWMERLIVIGKIAKWNIELS